jgi:hypothetical protein
MLAGKWSQTPVDFTVILDEDVLIFESVKQSFVLWRINGQGATYIPDFKHIWVVLVCRVD